MVKEVSLSMPCLALKIRASLSSKQFIIAILTCSLVYILYTPYKRSNVTLSISQWYPVNVNLYVISVRNLVVVFLSVISL